jgi:hypothetical protein
MALQMTFANIMDLFATLAPFLLGFFLVMASVFAQNIKGIVYIGGVLIASLLNMPIMSLVGSHIDPDAPLKCQMFDTTSMLVSGYNAPSPSTLFVAFTAAYLILPMIFNGHMNYAILATLLVLLCLDMVTKVMSRCTTVAGAIMGAIVGFVFAAAWYAIFEAAGLSSLMYFNEINSNRVLCKKPSKSTFKCAVYKNGQLVSTSQF